MAGTFPELRRPEPIADQRRIQPDRQFQLDPTSVHALRRHQNDESPAERPHRYSFTSQSAGYWLLFNTTDYPHSVQLSLPSDHPTDQRPSIAAGGLSDLYIFQQLHFHWGSDDSHGSEHTVNSIP